MKSDIQTVLFVSHDASRTGAPTVLLNFLRWFKQNTDIPFLILLQKGGPLESEFFELAPTFIVEKPVSYTLLQRIVRKFQQFLKQFGLSSEISQEDYQLRQFLRKANIGLIYSNTATNGLLLSKLSYLNCPIITHVHELNYALICHGITSFLSPDYQINHFITCADCVKAHLVNYYSISPCNITVVHEFISLIQAESNTSSLLKEKLSLPENTFVVGASGSPEWRKGTDLFIQLALRVHSKIEAPIHFVWIGGNSPPIQTMMFNHDIEHAGLKQYVHFIDSQPNPLDYFVDFNLLALTSREDPYPLVCLEVASLGKPIICFAGAGGAPEFIENDCGYVVPYLDLDAMADCIIELYQNPKLCQQLGRNASRKVKDRHLIEENAPKIYNLLQRYLSSSL